jgi:cell wall-associated NlpC family hydrolase
LILVLCIGGALAAGISSRTEQPRIPDIIDYLSDGPLESIIRVLTGLRAMRGSVQLEQAAAAGKALIAARVLTSSQRPAETVEEASISEQSGSGFRILTPEEKNVETIIGQTFGRYFRSYQIDGRTLTVRMPFGLNYEREGSPSYSQVFYLDGKGTPEQLWPYIDSVTGSEQFTDYVEAITSPGHKVILYELERQTYSLSRDPELFGSIRRGDYPGTSTRIFVRRSGGELSEADIYNYFYAIAAVGVDCSGFTFYIHDSIAKAYGKELSELLGEQWRTSPGNIGRRIGLWFYNPSSGYTEAVDDRIENLRPADVILFRGSDGEIKHSAVIQSIDAQKGIVRYVQNTDWAAEAERGAHKSVILFDPSRPEVSLKHYSVIWKQRVRPPFDGETEPRDWLTDRDRYAWYPTAGGSLIVRLKHLAVIFENREPLFYSNSVAEQESVQ